MCCGSELTVISENRGKLDNFVAVKVSSGNLGGNWNIGYFSILNSFLDVKCIHRQTKNI